MVKRARWFAGLTLISSLSGACVAVLGLDELHPRKGTDKVDSGTPACGEDSVDIIPKPPSVAAAPSGEPQTYLFAVSSLDLGIDLDNARPGFDLDHQTTMDLETNGCAFSPGDQGVILQYAKDPSNGVDNVTSKLLGLLGTFSPEFTATAINERLRRGKFGLVFSIQDWNGTDDDPEIRIQVFPALGIESANDPDGGLVTPTFTNRDRWRPDARFDPKAGGAPMLSSQAWVHDGIIAARFLELTLPFLALELDPKPFDARLINVWVATRLSKSSNGTLTLSSGTIGARLRTNDLFKEMRYVNVGPSLRVCSVPGLVALLRKQSCMVRDVRENYCDDNLGLPCEALSFGAGFEAYRVDAPGSPRTITNQDYAEADRAAKASLGQGYDVPPPSQRCTQPTDAPATIDCEEPDAD